MLECGSVEVLQSASTRNRAGQNSTVYLLPTSCVFPANQRRQAQARDFVRAYSYCVCWLCWLAVAGGRAWWQARMAACETLMMDGGACLLVPTALARLREVDAKKRGPSVRRMIGRGEMPRAHPPRSALKQGTTSTVVLTPQCLPVPYEKSSTVQSTVRVQ